MEHPILFINLILDKMGIHVPSVENIHSFTDALVQPHITYAWLIMGTLIVLGYLAAKSVQMVPAGGQNFFEMVLTGLEDYMVGITGEEGRPMFPLIASLGLFILVSNYSGMIPGFFAPTANINTTLACAAIVVFWTHVLGIKFHGAKYIKHFMGPVTWLAPLMFIIEVIGHIARLFSLTMRLFGNIQGEELVLAILFTLAGLYMAPLPMMVLGLLTGFIQAFIFCTLSLMYFAGAMEHAH